MCGRRQTLGQSRSHSFAGLCSAGSKCLGPCHKLCCWPVTTLRLVDHEGLITLIATDTVHNGLFLKDSCYLATPFARIDTCLIFH